MVTIRPVRPKHALTASGIALAYAILLGLLYLGTGGAREVAEPLPAAPTSSSWGVP